MAVATETVVECYSGHSYAQEPRAFWLDSGRRTVTMVRRRWREPTGPSFEVLADDGHHYVLAYAEATDCWSVAAKADDREFSSCSQLKQITTHKEDGR